MLRSTCSGGTPICNVQMDEQEVATLTTKQRSATSLVRKAQRRIRTRECPSLELRTLEQESAVAKIPADSSLVPMQRGSTYSGSDDDYDCPRAEIQIKMEATTMRTVCRPQRRSGHNIQMMSNSEPMRALPMPGLKQSLEAINKSMGQTVLPRLKLGNERQAYDQEAGDVDNYTSDLEYEEEGPIASSSPGRSQEDDQEEVEVEEEPEPEPVLRLPPLTKQNSNLSRRVVLEQDEDGTVYIVSSPKSKRSLKRFVAS